MDFMSMFIMLSSKPPSSNSNSCSVRLDFCSNGLLALRGTTASTDLPCSGVSPSPGGAAYVCSLNILSKIVQLLFTLFFTATMEKFPNQ